MGKGLTPQQERLFAAISGLVFVLGIIIIALFIPKPTYFQTLIFFVVLSGAMIGFFVFAPGFITVRIPGMVKAGGVAAVFVAIFFFGPSLFSPDKQGSTPPDSTKLDIKKSPLTDSIESNIGFRITGHAPPELIKNIEATTGLEHGNGKNAFVASISHNAKIEPARSKGRFFTRIARVTILVNGEPCNMNSLRLSIPASPGGSLGNPRPDIEAHIERQIHKIILDNLGQISTRIIDCGLK